MGVSTSTYYSNQLRAERGSMNSEDGLGVRYAGLGPQVGNCRNGLNAADVVDRQLDGQSPKEVIETHAVCDRSSWEAVQGGSAPYPEYPPVRIHHFLEVFADFVCEMCARIRT
jgi:hypothetical protein